MNTAITSTTNWSKVSNKETQRTSQVNALKWKRCDNNYAGQTLPEKCGGRSIPNSFCEATITMNQNEAEMPHRKENYRLTSLMNINAKILRKTLANKTKQNKNTWKESYTKFKWGLSQGCKDSSLCANQLMYTILTNWKIKTIW